MNDKNAKGSAVVARFNDGRIVKGMTHDFAPQKLIFHLSVSGDASGRALTVPVGALKALFFVKSFEGDPKRVEDDDIRNAKGQGRKIVVTFDDGEALAGFTTDYGKDKRAFFVTPVDPDSNNLRVFVVTAAVKKIAWADDATTSIGA